MSAERKIWATPSLGEVSVRSVLTGSDLPATVSAGLMGGPSIGPNGIAEASFGLLSGPFGGPTGGLVFGPLGPVLGNFGPQSAPLFGLQLASLDGPPPAPLFGPPVPAPAFSGPPVPSDARLKEDVRQTGTTAHGLPLYAFSYRGQAGTYEGVMAQDVLAVRPDAVVVGADGFYRVDYAKLGIAFRRLH